MTIGGNVDAFGGMYSNGLYVHNNGLVEVEGNVTSGNIGSDTGVHNQGVAVRGYSGVVSDPVRQILFETLMASDGAEPPVWELPAQDASNQAASQKMEKGAVKKLNFHSPPFVQTPDGADFHIFMRFSWRIYSGPSQTQSILLHHLSSQNAGVCTDLLYFPPGFRSHGSLLPASPA